MVAKRQEVLRKVQEHVYRQLDDPIALQELKSLGPGSFDWYDRVKKTIDTLIPRFVEIAPKLVKEGVSVFNGPYQVHELLQASTPDKGLQLLQSANGAFAGEFSTWLADSRRVAAVAARNIHCLESQQISAEIQRYLVSSEGLEDLARVNGNSLYPDLLLKSYDYSFLPIQSRSKPVDGPCQKGDKPSNVPDGCEIKTNKGKSIRVDAHGAHPGLHVAITWERTQNRVDILDFWVAFIRIADHSHSDGKMDVTTKKRSFGHKHFVSLISGGKKDGKVL